ncbi:hypothetical protein HELRODRAFT_162724 [Helobdella robusta]|uniref:Uncharacterized protein n=1 Tax=Helobdella robusta TaxID=6412 RepID=T1ET20_HELRO|nr:hypothetical protein HELRODRAFT_162724 [Helobdella robusta]ESN99212.1 hypothetical protein HELRODRAFT_162724 [Helobdella robusta]
MYKQPNSPSSLLVKYPANNAIPNKLTSCKAQQIVLKKVISSNSSTTFSMNSLAVTKPIYTVRLPSRSSKVGPAVVTASSTVSTSTGSILQRKQVVLVPKGLKTNNSEPFIILQPNGNNNVTVNPSNHFSSIINKNINNKSNEKVTEATSSSSTSDELSLVINATNVWFGSARTTPVRPIAVNDRGLLITCQNNFLKKGSGGKTTRIYSVKDLIQFQIKPEDIIKCCAYLGSQRKHTIFLFLLPNCIRSFKQMISVIDTSPDAAEGFCDSCLIAIFTPALSRHDISQLVYFMWHFGQSSLFGPTIYSEICQKSALSLLSNIKPALLASKCFVESSESFSSFSSPSKPQPPAKPSQTATQNSSAGEDSGDNGVKLEPIITNPLSFFKIMLSLSFLELRTYLETICQTIPSEEILVNNTSIIYGNKNHSHLRIAEAIFINQRKPQTNKQQRIATSLPTRRILLKDFTSKENEHNEDIINGQDKAE